MPTNTSASGGILTPNSSPAPLEGDALVNFFQAWVAGVTGIAGNLVWPRWQAEPPNLPDATVDWIAVGIVRREKDTFAAELHDPTGLGYNAIRRHEVLHLLASFYGPNADNTADIFAEGIQVEQNREILGLNNMGLIASGDATAVPELVKEKWMYKVDMPFSIRRQIVRNYQVENLLSAVTALNNEIYVETIIN